ncbi:hypothetical protein VTN31DRAFT_2414 [Thermomyces dupontii]|uniref:uncharacterized protein n=1 Tax=Talaromyces thermophilus TaxID=28565 RepID=UPI003742B498
MEEHYGHNVFVTGQSRHDIVGSLPLELVVHVVEYLDQADIIRSQRVSRRWRSVLSSNTLIKSVQCRTLAALGLEATNVKSTNPMTYIRWLHGLEFARPVRKLFIPLFPTPQNCEYIAYHSRRLCYIMPDRNNLAMLDFETGKRSIFSKDTGGILLPSDCLIAILFVALAESS